MNPAHRGTKAALRYGLTVPAGETAEIRLRFSDGDEDLGNEFERVHDQRRREADEFYAELAGMATDEEAAVMRQAFAGLLWSKQFYFYDVNSGSTATRRSPLPRPSAHTGRNADWRHLNNFDVISMPDTWEYPWYAAWDLAFHCVALAHVDPAFAKHQLMLLCREWFMHPNGQLPAYEWAFGDVNPPVHAWAALRVFEIDGSRDIEFLERIFHKLTLNFTWWINRKDAEGNNVFEGGFLGLDNIGPFDRSQQLPGDVHLEQSDGTAWMAMFCLNMLEISLVLAAHQPAYEDMRTKFFEHFTYIADGHERPGPVERRGRVLLRRPAPARPGERHPDARAVDGRAASRCARRPRWGRTRWRRLPEFSSRLQWFLRFRNRVRAGRGRRRPRERPRGAAAVDRVARSGSSKSWRRCSTRTSSCRRTGSARVSRYHLEHPFELDLDGTIARVDYEPGESHDRRVRRELELARPGVVPGELPADRGAPAVPPVPRRRLHGRVPDRVGPAAARSARSPTTWRSGW